MEWLLVTGVIFPFIIGYNDAVTKPLYITGGMARHQT